MLLTVNELHVEVVDKVAARLGLEVETSAELCAGPARGLSVEGLVDAWHASGAYERFNEGDELARDLIPVVHAYAEEHYQSQTEYRHVTADYSDSVGKVSAHLAASSHFVSRLRSDTGASDRDANEADAYLTSVLTDGSLQCTCTRPAGNDADGIRKDAPNCEEHGSDVPPHHVYPWPVNGRSRHVRLVVARGDWDPGPNRLLAHRIASRASVLSRDLFWKIEDAFRFLVSDYQPPSHDVRVTHRERSGYNTLDGITVPARFGAAITMEIKLEMTPRQVAEVYEQARAHALNTLNDEWALSPGDLAEITDRRRCRTPERAAFYAEHYGQHRRGELTDRDLRDLWRERTGGAGRASEQVPARFIDNCRRALQNVLCAIPSHFEASQEMRADWAGVTDEDAPAEQKNRTRRAGSNVTRRWSR